MRPSLATQRREEMLAALEDCVREYGIKGATTERIAQVAGWTRGNVRHYLGNKEDQRRALVERLTDRYATTLSDALGAAPSGSRLSVIVDTLFGESWQQDRERDGAVLDQLVAYEAANPGTNVAIRSMYEKLGSIVAQALVEEHPDFSPTEAEDTGYVVVSLAYGVATMTSMGWWRPTATESTLRFLLAAGAHRSDSHAKH